MVDIGRINRVALREVWPHEARDFTTWLEENIDVVGDAVDLQLTKVEREHPAGTFSADLVAESPVGAVIVENQLGKSDHDHLGKAVTYLSQLDAKAAIWIVADPRPEHVQAVSWLNESSSADFYIAKVEAISIGDSAPAPLFTLITGPSPEAKQAGETKKELAERDKARQRFWAGLLEAAKAKTKLHSGISPGHYGWIGSGAGLPSGLSLNYSVRMHDAQVELYIDGGQDSEDDNLKRFKYLFDRKDNIEAEFGSSLEWEEMATRRACRVSRPLSIGGWADEDKWPQAQQALVDAMIRLEQALRPHLVKMSS